jgi:hypothetical protein
MKRDLEVEKRIRIKRRKKAEKIKDKYLKEFKNFK